MPTDKLTIRSTNFDSSEKENMAAKLILNTPAIVVVMRMDDSREGIWNLEWIYSATGLQLDHKFAIKAIRRVYSSTELALFSFSKAWSFAI
nr:hypothetical protein [uncultured Undibacterium sp.]